MDAPRNHPEEKARLRALRSLEILDSEAEERFNRITRLARQLFQVPIALVSLVDEDRQWFKSRQGLDAPETSREISFCGHAILGSETFVVGNTHDDPRFADNPLVTGDPSIAFYAGRPLSSPDGSPIGTLCIIDRCAREISAGELEALNDLAALVEGEFEAVERATIDSLTEISNRRGFEVLADKALAFCRRCGHEAAVLFIDMDGFKAINDGLGHEAGDRALQDMASILSETFRESDVVARLGGDEFCVLMTLTTASSTTAAIRRLSAAVEKHNAEANRDYELRFSVGAASFDPALHEGVACLLRDADAQMYDDKSDKRARLAS